jgi:NitT/TauT family transport system substrate-binding protein
MSYTNRSTKWNLFTACALVLIAANLLLQSCRGYPASLPPTITPSPTKVKLLLLPFLSFAPFMIADQEGFFAQQGLEIEFLRMDRGTEAIAALAQNDLDVYAGAINVGILAAMQKVGIRIVASKGHFDPQGCTYITTMARKDLIDSGRLDSVSGARGLVVDMNARANIREYYFDSLLDSAGMKISDVELASVPDEAAGEALKNGSLDLVPITDPWVTIIQKGGVAVSWMPAQQVLPNYHFAFIAYSERFIKQHPDAANRFMVAFLKAVRQYNQGKTDRNLEILAEATGLDQASLLSSCWPAIVPDGVMNVQDILDFQTWAASRGMLDPPLLSAEQVWDGRFVEYALKALDR